MVGSIVRLDDSNLPAACCADEVNQLNELVVSMREAAASARAPFQWVDGPLVTAMRQGDMILIDELNLAEDAVLERLNRQASASIALCLTVMVAHEQWQVGGKVTVTIHYSMRTHTKHSKQSVAT